MIDGLPDFRSASYGGLPVPSISTGPKLPLMLPPLASYFSVTVWP